MNGEPLDQRWARGDYLPQGPQALHLQHIGAVNPLYLPPQAPPEYSSLPLEYNSRPGDDPTERKPYTVEEQRVSNEIENEIDRLKSIQTTVADVDETASSNPESDPDDEHPNRTEGDNRESNQQEEESKSSKRLKSGAQYCLGMTASLACKLGICCSIILLGSLGTGIGVAYTSRGSSASDGYHPSSFAAKPTYDDPPKYDTSFNNGRKDRIPETTKNPDPGKACGRLQCLNGGICGYGRWCDCPRGTSGLSCEEEVTTRSTTQKPTRLTCHTLTCLNGGRCVNGVFSSAQCQCPVGTSGARCEILITTTTRTPDTCRSLTCQHGGYCVELSTSARCVCPAYASGTQCQVVNTATTTMSPDPTQPTSSPPSPRTLDEPYIIFSDENQLIKAAQLDGSNVQTLLDKGIDIAYDYNERVIFCTETFPYSKIVSANLAQRTPDSPILNVDYIEMIMSRPASFQGLAFDWVHDNIYWADSSSDQISVMNINTRHQKTIIETDIGELTKLVVDPRDDQRWLYYVGTQGQINKVGLDGTRQHALIPDQEEAWKHALTIDFKNNKLYWIAVYQDRLEGVDLDGSNRAAIFTSSNHMYGAFSIIQYGDFIYWSQSTRHSGHNSYIKRINITDVSTFSIETIISNSDVFMGIRDIEIFDSSRQPDAASVCGGNNGGCSHLCLPVPYQSGSTTNFTCACPDGMELGSDGATCLASDV